MPALFTVLNSDSSISDNVKEQYHMFKVNVILLFLYYISERKSSVICALITTDPKNDMPSIFYDERNNQENKLYLQYSG